jgi:hypothetical protein
MARVRSTTQPRNTQNMPVFRNVSSAKGTGENGLLGIEGVNLRAFLQGAHPQSGFNDFTDRRQCDYKPMMWRK